MCPACDSRRVTVVFGQYGAALAVAQSNRESRRADKLPQEVCLVTGECLFHRGELIGVEGLAGAIMHRHHHNCVN